MSSTLDMRAIELPSAEFDKESTGCGPEPPD